MIDAAINRGGHWKSVNKFGNNSDIDTGTDPEDVWDGGGIWAAPTTARTHNIASTSANDTSDGTGAQTIQVQGLDENYDLAEETVTMDGTSDVATVNTYTMIHRMYVVTAGSGNQNAGTITATAVTDSTVTAQINATNNQTLMAIYQVPNNYTGFMTSLYGTINLDVAKPTNAGANLKLFVKPFGGVFQLKHLDGLNTYGSSRMAHEFHPYFKIEEKSLIKVNVSQVTDDNTDVSSGFGMILINNDYLDQID